MSSATVIKLSDMPNGVFEVTVGGTHTTVHTVKLNQDYFAKLAKQGESPESLIERSFGFLLEREPNTSILDEFDLSVISNYFPDYEQQITS